MEFVRDFSHCPRCGAPTKKSVTWAGTESEFWYECTKCNTYINTYIPQAHQMAVHLDKHKYVGNFGGYGSGKTTTSREEIYKHIFITPRGNTLIGANVQSQYEQTIKRDIENDLPRAFFTAFSTQKQYFEMINGHRVLYRPFDDPEKLRSYNLTMFLIMEGSEVKQASFTQLKSRLRNMAASLPKLDKKGKPTFKRAKNGVPIPIIETEWLKGIVESNPDSGWIKSEVLTKSSDIQKHGTINDVYAVLEEEADPAISSHVTASDCNEFLPESFIPDLIKNKPLWWTNRYVYGSFLYAEGLVYPSAMRFIVEDFPVPKNWVRIAAYDYGLSDDSVFLFGAIDEEKGLLYIYKEVRTNNRSVEELANLFLEAAADVPVGGWLTSPIIDPKSGPKRDYEKKTLADHFAEFGVYFKPGHINVDARVFRTNTYFESGKVRIFKSCTGLIQELREYKFQQKNFSEEGWGDKPEDKNNHGINPLEWIIMELPADPRKLSLGVYNRMGQNLAESHKKAKEIDDYAYYKLVLSDPEEDEAYTSGPFGANY